MESWQDWPEWCLDATRTILRSAGIVGRVLRPQEPGSPFLEIGIVSPEYTRPMAYNGSDHRAGSSVTIADPVFPAPVYPAVT